MYSRTLQQLLAVEPPTRVGGTYRDTEQRIIEASVQMFSRFGYVRSSTREIATLAGVTEVTIFRHFPKKRDLFWAVTEACLGRLQVNSELAALMETDAEPKVVLPKFVASLVELIHEQPETVRLLYVCLFELDDGSDMLVRKHLGPLFESFREYLSRAVSKGLLHVDPEVATFSMAASIAAQHGLRHLMKNKPCSVMEAEVAISALTRFWLNALLPDYKGCDGVSERTC
ncbi:MAG: transcriptional regulator [Acidobacteriaceae bacterium]|nr:transcriptional regulator [Acidobacteriaceae bacterium]